GTDGEIRRENGGKKVPPVVPSGADNGTVRLALGAYEPVPNCTDINRERNKNGDHEIAVTPNDGRRTRTTRLRSASGCTTDSREVSQVSPTGVEPVTFGSGGRRPDSTKIDTSNQLGQHDEAEVPTVVPSSPVAVSDRQFPTDLATVIAAWDRLP